MNSPCVCIVTAASFPLPAAEAGGGQAGRCRSPSWASPVGFCRGRGHRCWSCPVTWGQPAVLIHRKRRGQAGTSAPFAGLPPREQLPRMPPRPAWAWHPVCTARQLVPSSAASLSGIAIGLVLSPQAPAMHLHLPPSLHAPCGDCFIPPQFLHVGGGDSAELLARPRHPLPRRSRPGPSPGALHLHPPQGEFRESGLEHAANEGCDGAPGMDEQRGRGASRAERCAMVTGASTRHRCCSRRPDKDEARGLQRSLPRFLEQWEGHTQPH